MRNRVAIFMAIAAAGAVPVTAQLGVPPLSGTARNVIGTVDRTLDPLQQSAHSVVNSAAQLSQRRLARLSALVRRNRETIELDEAGEPARKGELLLVNPSEADLVVAQRAGFGLLERETLGELRVSIARLAIPARMTLARAEVMLRQLLPQATVTADNLHNPAGGSVNNIGRAQATGAAAIGIPIGLIDGAPGSATRVNTIRGFAAGAPRSGDHGSATASLLRSAGARNIAIADVYGTDPAGGNALAISRAINWLILQRVRVISISLVGPGNPLLGQVIAAGQRRGLVFVAAVGNDGPAAPPAYPASYPGVIAVTGVDGRNRALIEAGRALHLDYAAPGADMVAANAAGRWVRVRGTSYAVPLVAARAAAAVASGASVTTALDREAVDLGGNGPDSTYGRGLLCGSCRRGR